MSLVPDSELYNISRIYIYAYLDLDEELEFRKLRQRYVFNFPPRFNVTPGYFPKHQNNLPPTQGIIKKTFETWFEFRERLEWISSSLSVHVIHELQVYLDRDYVGPASV